MEKILGTSQTLADQLEKLNENVTQARESLEKIEARINRLEQYPQLLRHEKQNLKKELEEIRKQLSRLYPGSAVKENILQMERDLAKWEADRTLQQADTVQQLNKIQSLIKTDIIQKLNKLQSHIETMPLTGAKGTGGTTPGLSEGQRKFRSLIVGIATAADVIAAGTIAWAVINSPSEIIYRGFYVVVLFFVLAAIVLAAFALKMD